jgi:ABC-type branched-subunit amino acid transport system ATPase component
MSGALLEVRDLVKHYGGVAAVDGAGFDVAAASVTALIGPNGAGKTTLFNIVSGFVRAEGGQIRFRGEPIEGWTPHRVAASGLVRTFQTARALTRMTVLENMLLAAPGQPGEHVWRLLLTPRAVGRHERANRKRARELLAFVQLDALADDYAGTLSGGQRKLLEFARALMAEPKMMLLDEPMAGVNPVLGEQLLAHVLELRAEQAMTFLLVEHDVEIVMSMCDTVIVMNEGAVIAAGRPEAVRRDPAVADAYLGAHPPAPERAS